MVGCRVALRFTVVLRVHWRYIDIYQLIGRRVGSSAGYERRQWGRYDDGCSQKRTFARRERECAIAVDTPRSARHGIMLPSYLRGEYCRKGWQKRTLSRETHRNILVLDECRAPRCIPGSERDGSRVHMH